MILLYTPFTYLNYNLYYSSNISRVIKLRMKWAGHVAQIEEKRKAYKILYTKHEGKRPFGRPRHR
jgi:hypothetical protein